MLERLRIDFPIVFGGGGKFRNHSKAYRDFGRAWGFWKTLYEMASGKIEEIDYIKSTHVTDFLFWLTFMIQKGEADEAEDDYQNNLRKSKKKF